MEHAVALLLWNGSHIHRLCFCTYFCVWLRWPFQCTHSRVQKNRTGLQAQMWFLLTVSYKTVESVTPTQICLRLSSPGHTFMYLVELIPPNSTHSDSLVKGHIGKPLVLIMLYSHPYLLSCRLITIHSLVSMWVCVAFSVWPHVCVCLRVCVQQTTRVLWTVMNHFHYNGFGAPQSPPPSTPLTFYEKVNCTGATFYSSSSWLRRVARSWAMSAEWDWILCTSNKMRLDWIGYGFPAIWTPGWNKRPYVKPYEHLFALCNSK